MKLLLDESIPRPLGGCFPKSFEMRTVPRMGWAGRSNGDLPRLAADQEFVACITADQGIGYQQNLSNLFLPVIVLIASRTRVRELRPLVAQEVDLINGELQRRVYRVVEQRSAIDIRTSP